VVTSARFFRFFSNFSFPPRRCFVSFNPLEQTNMAVERTLSIIKPDAVAKNVIGKIYSRFESNGLKVIAARMAGCPSRKPVVSMPSTRHVPSTRIWSVS